MAFAKDEIDELKRAFATLATASEGGTEFILIPSFTLPDGCKPQSVDALFCPTPRDGYVSRLFLSEKIEHQGPGKNWNANGVTLLGRHWWAVSWNAIQSNSPPPSLQRLAAILARQLEAFRCK